MQKILEVGARRASFAFKIILKNDLLVLAAIVLITRLAFVALFGSTLSLSTSGYDDYARHLMAGQGYTRFADLHPDSDLPPLYSFVLVAIYSVFGRSAIAVALVQIVFEIGTVLLITLIGRSLGGRRVGFLAGLLTALYPYQLFQNLTVNDTAIFMLLLTAAIYFAYRGSKSARNQWLYFALCGALLGGAALTKTLVLLILPMLSLIWWRQTTLRTTLYRSALLIGAFGLVLAPWLIRNWQLHGTFVLISTNGGSNFYQANNRCSIPYMEAGWDVQWSDAGGCLQAVPAGLTDTQADRWQQQQGIDFLAAHSELWARLLVDKFVVLWSPDITPRGLPPTLGLAAGDPVAQYSTPTFEIARKVHLIYFTPLLILASIGGVLAVLRKRPIAPLLTVLIAITVTYLVFHPSTRYRAPADPFVFVLAAYALVSLWAMLTRSVAHSTQ